MMRRTKSYWIGMVTTIVGFAILIGTYLSLVISYPDVTSYSFALEDHSNGDTVNIIGWTSDSDTTNDGRFYIILDGCEYVEFTDDNTKAYVYRDAIIYFDRVPTGVTENNYVVIEGKVVEDSYGKYIKGLDAEVITGGHVYLWNQLCPFAHIMMILISFFIIAIGGVIFWFGHLRTLNLIAPYKSIFKRRRFERLATMLMIFGGAILILGIWFTEILTYFSILGILLFIIGIIIHYRIFKFKLQFCIDTDDIFLYDKFNIGLKKIKISLILFLFSLSVLSAFLGAELLIWRLQPPPDIVIPSGFLNLLFIGFIIFIIACLLFMSGIRVDTRRYDPKVEEVLFEPNRIKLVLYSIFIVFLLYGILYPFYFQNMMPELQLPEQDEYSIQIGTFGEGSKVTFQGEVLHYKVENGKTYVILSDSNHPYFYSSWDEGGIYHAIVFDEDISDKLHGPDPIVLITGTIYTKEDDDSGEEVKLVQGENIKPLYELELLIFKITITLGLIGIISIFYSFFRYRNLENTLDYYIETNDEKKSKVQKTQPIVHAGIVRTKSITKQQKVQCPKCEAMFVIVEDQSELSCPHCGFSGKLMGS